MARFVSRHCFCEVGGLRTSDLGLPGMVRGNFLKSKVLSPKSFPDGSLVNDIDTFEGFGERSFLGYSHLIICKLARNGNIRFLGDLDEIEELV